ncbi:transglycosylase SLT domain-containing protein [Kiloniella laminariae]|uniref:Transglycosylase SLT domain-containing protein n=1 Tax=Kiloniella laminariae TaxID=454162 RepID=A0ABT4LIE6_9PROT|nr:transglycosylase SLT domain-containing protein [Kiloniella laminariae]MCZ4280885.1 transglycosylase SLT domain-containing protein [Kiloniella laminariae]
MRFVLFIFVLCLTSAGLSLKSRSALASQITGNSDVCASIISSAEQRETIPLHLLRAISLVESGKWDKEKGARVAWPWTVMAEGKGRYLPTKQAAIAEVEKLKAKGVRNIDVGCMQVNLHHHAKAFPSLEDAFDPHKNVAYAAQFLTRLRQDSPSWTAAVGRYHSNNQKFSTPYRKKVLTAWRDEKHRLNKEARRQELAQRVENKADIKKARNPGGIATSHIKSETTARLVDKVPSSIPSNSPRKTEVATSSASIPEATNTSSHSLSRSGPANRSIATRLLMAPKG